MKRGRFSEEQIVGTLKAQEADRRSKDRGAGSGARGRWGNALPMKNSFAEHRPTLLRSRLRVRSSFRLVLAAVLALAATV